MIAAPIPLDEDQRLTELRAMNILDTPAEERFDRVVRLATRVFDVPMAYIALVDSDRQWFKSKCGVATDQTGRDVSFCGHTILQQEPLIIQDAKSDDRFHDNPLVTGDPHIRFYAGYPLAGPNGRNIGTLCLADRKPRLMDDRQMMTFRELAAVAEHELNMVDVIRTQRSLIEVKDALAATQKRLAEELDEAADYVRSLLPPKLDGPIQTDWQFISSSQLGGDFFGYHWLDDRWFVIYLLDVCGHGVGASLLSISMHNALRRETLPDTRFDQPGKVLSALNRAFPMTENNNKFSTMWYGAYDTKTRTMHFATAGHPPAILFDGPGNPPTHLDTPNLILGLLPDTEFETHSHVLPPGSRLYVFSDGAFEVPMNGDGEMLGMEGLTTVMDKAGSTDRERVDSIVKQLQSIHGTKDFLDDCSLVEVVFA